MKKVFDCVQMMRQVREGLSKRYAGKPDLMAKELREARSRFEARLGHGKRTAVAEKAAQYGVQGRNSNHRLEKFGGPSA